MFLALGMGYAIAESSMITRHRSVAICTALPVLALFFLHEPVGILIRRIDGALRHGTRR